MSTNHASRSACWLSYSARDPPGDSLETSRPFLIYFLYLGGGGAENYRSKKNCICSVALIKHTGDYQREIGRCNNYCIGESST